MPRPVRERDLRAARDQPGFGQVSEGDVLQPVPRSAGELDADRGVLDGEAVELHVIGPHLDGDARARGRQDARPTGAAAEQHYGPRDEQLLPPDPVADPQQRPGRSERERGAQGGEGTRFRSIGSLSRRRQKRRTHGCRGDLRLRLLHEEHDRRRVGARLPPPVRQLTSRARCANDERNCLAQHVVSRSRTLV